MSLSTDNQNPSAPSNIYVCSYVLKGSWGEMELRCDKLRTTREDAALGMVLRSVADENRTMVSPKVLIHEIKPTDHYHIS